MAISPTMVAGLVSGGSNLLDTGVNAALSSITNAQNKRFAVKMYNRQRSDALADWNTQNAYNAPSAQMDRLKAAKLNPNLIYGNGVQASGLASPVRASSAPSYKGEAPQINTGGAVSAFVDTEMKNTNMDVMKSVIALNNARKAQTDADTIVKGAQKGMLDVGTAAKAFKLGLDKSLVGITVDTASAQLDKLKAEKDKIVTDTFMTMHEDIRRAMLSKATFEQKMQNVALMAAQEYATREGAGLTSDKRTEIAQHVSNMIKQGELMELEKTYNSAKNEQQWMEQLKGLMPTLLLPITGGGKGVNFNTPRESPWRALPSFGGNRRNY